MASVSVDLPAARLDRALFVAVAALMIATAYAVWIGFQLAVAAAIAIAGMIGAAASR